MQAVSIIEKMINQLEEDYCECECTECSRYIGCAVLEAKNYLSEELGSEDE